MEEFNVNNVNTDRILERFPDEDCLKSVALVSFGREKECLVLVDVDGIRVFVPLDHKNEDAYESWCAVIQYASFLFPEEMEGHKAACEDEIYDALYYAIEILVKRFPVDEESFVYDDDVLEPETYEESYVETITTYKDGIKHLEKITHNLI